MARRQALNYVPKVAKVSLPRLLLTRAHAQAAAFAAEVRADTSLAPIIAPMQEMRDLAVKIDLSGIRALAFTSKNGVAAFARMSSVRLPAFCVGEATAALARAQGFEAQAATGDAESLIKILPLSGVLHVHGRHVARPLGVKSLAIYDQVALPLNPKAKAQLVGDQFEAVAVFSPRSARILSDVLPEKPLANTVFYALSPAVASALPHGQNTRICATPSAESMLRLLSADFPA